MRANESLYNGVSGLQAASDGMSIITDAIANSQTKGHKVDRAEFENMLSTGMTDLSKIGRGARLRNVSTVFNQGTLTPTGQITDMGIKGEGFFIVKHSRSEVKESSGRLYTRQGSFRFDKDGYLVDYAGGRVQGYMNNGQSRTSLALSVSDIQIVTNTIAPKPTELINVVANLDVREKPLIQPFNPRDPTATSNFGTAVTVYDNLGYGHQLSVYFRHNPGEGNTWEWHALANGDEVSDKPALDEKGKPLPVELVKGQLVFDKDGKPELKFTNRVGEPTQVDVLEKSDAIELKFRNATAQKIQFNFGPTIDEGGEVGSYSTTSVAARSALNFHSQNGYETGYIQSIKIDPDGSIYGVYTNGLLRRLAAIALATFPNNQGLEKVGHNNYVSTQKAGEPNVGTPETGRRGSVYSSNLEESNVDLAKTFVDMIITERGFQANSKSIATTDNMLQEVINLKR